MSKTPSDERRMLRYPVSIDCAERSELFLPVDLQPQEADRICAMILALVTPGKNDIERA